MLLITAARRSRRYDDYARWWCRHGFRRYALIYDAAATFTRRHAVFDYSRLPMPDDTIIFFFFRQVRGLMGVDDARWRLRCYGKR